MLMLYALVGMFLGFVVVYALGGDEWDWDYVLLFMLAWPLCLLALFAILLGKGLRRVLQGP